MNEDTTRQELARFLAERDVACPGCSYNLRGLNAARCPECGLALSVRMLRGDVRLTVAWWIGFAPLAVIALPAVPLIAFGVASAAAHIHEEEFVGGFASAAVAMSALCGGIMELRWLRTAEVFVSRSPKEQWAGARRSWLVFTILAIAVVGMVLSIDRGWS
jgi:hypothetical protein